MRLDPTMMPFDPSPYQENVAPYIVGGLICVAIGWIVLRFASITWHLYLSIGVVLVGIVSVIFGSYASTKEHANTHVAAREHFRIVNDGPSTYRDYSNTFRLPTSAGSTVTLRGYTIRNDDGSFSIRDLVIEKRQDETYTMSYVVNEVPAS